MTSEFSIIQQYFSGIDFAEYPPTVGIGDDAAIIDVPEGMSLAVSSDTLVSGVHFFADDPASAIAYKAIAVNLSDMAAMGANPQWLTLALTLPADLIRTDHRWLMDFREGLEKIAREYRLSLIGGDTTQGPLTISIQIKGLVKKKRFLCRSHAQVGDVIFVSGTVGNAGAGLLLKQGKLSTEQLKDFDYLVRRLQYPTPRIELGQAIVGHAHAAIDVSDGLLADLEHILQASGVGARVDLDCLPLSQAYVDTVSGENSRHQASIAGDDYELCFTAPPSAVSMIKKIAHEYAVDVAPIGVIEAEKGLRCFMQEKLQNFEQRGYQHF